MPLVPSSLRVGVIVPTETYTSTQYLLDDQNRTLFPMSTTKVLVQNAGDTLLGFARGKILTEETANFLPALRCYASKQGYHLRRTVKLDPVSEIYIYDLICRNQQSFRGDLNSRRKSFGYRFNDGKPEVLTQSYSSFKKAVRQAARDFKYAAKFDISNYFNSVYHHDLVRHFSTSFSDEDTKGLGKFLRESNAGRSVDCLPQGIHPCKVMGADFLRTIDNSVVLRSDLQLRFMDDFYIFSNHEQALIGDLVSIQHLLGERGLSLNSEKTSVGDVDIVDYHREVDAIKRDLLNARRRAIAASSIDFDDDDDDPLTLSEEQIEYLLELLKDPDIDESDAELVLVLLRDHEYDVLEHLDGLLVKFPSLAKNVYAFSKYVEDQDSLAYLVLNFVSTCQHATEYQLFWMTKIAEDYLRSTLHFADLVAALKAHPQATDLTQAKLLEIPENGFGMPDLREMVLREGSSNWKAWGAAVGCRTQPRLQRNHVLGYFANCSPLNALVADCIRKL